MTAESHSPHPLPLGAKFKIFARDIKLSHTVFAMPWALLATFLAAEGIPRAGQLALIVVCMVTARTLAMSSNRLLDAPLDAQNPRTARRALPCAQLSRRFFVAASAACAFAFVLATSLFGIIYSNWLPLILSIPVLLFISVYPLLKRFTQLCHYYLGAALALAPVCAWIAISPEAGVTPFLMAGAVWLWTAGFDIIYAAQDYQSDLDTGVFSLPAKLGIARSLWIARITHAGTLAFMIALGFHSPLLGTLYFVGVACAAGLLLIEHALVRVDDLSRVGLAFFTMNGMISVLVGALGIIDVFV